MIAVFLICCAIYILMTFVTLFATKRVGNILTILGIVIADGMALYCFINYFYDRKISSLIVGIIHLIYGTFCCYLVGVVTKRIEQYRLDKGYKLNIGCRKKSTAVILAFVGGWCGIHKFYLRRKSQGALYAMYFYTFVPLIVSIIEAIRYLMMGEDEFDDRYNSKSNQIYDVSDGGNKQPTRYLSNKKLAYNNKQLNIGIGTALIKGKERDRMKISITNSNGKTFVFETQGNEIKSFKIAGQPKKFYGEV